MALRDEVLELLRRDPAFREELRRQLLTEELLALPALFRELAAQVHQLAEAQRRTEDRLAQLTERVDRLTERVERLAEQMQELVSWQRGEAGRRDGERFEREVSLRALRLFSGGRGGAPSEAWVRERLTEQLQAGVADDVSAEEDPLLADLVWWKGDQVAVVEISLQVNGGDLTRAAACAATLARAGVRALPVVIGEAWARPETVRQAEALGIAWKVGADPSAGFLAFRRAA